jgi:hypothetical protein
MTAHHWSSLADAYVPPPQAPSHRSFGYTVGGVLAVAGALSYWRGHALRAEIAGAVALYLLASAAIWPSSLAPLARGWGKIGHALGWFNSRVLLTLMFVFVFCPIGLIGRLFGKDPLDAKRGGRSLWVDYTARLRDPKHYERLF